MTKSQWFGTMILVALVLGIAADGLAQGRPASAQDAATEPADLRTLTARASAGDAAAQFALGWRLHEAHDVTQDYDQAAAWLRRAADQGHLQAQVRLGNLYEWGHGVPEEPATAALWYRRAADGGLPQAQFALGLLYRRGTGVAADPTLALQWFTRSAAGGFPIGAFAAAELYRSGEGVPADPVEAYAWLLVATALPDAPPFVSAARADLAITLTPPQVLDAEHRASAHHARRRAAAPSAPVHP